MNIKYLFIGYWLSIISLFLYSYTQVDLNLTLSQWSIWQIIQKTFQYIGWFQRSLSTALYLIIIFLLFTFYFLLLWMIRKNKVTIKQFWWLTGVTSIVLLFSYNAFSYDLFNYMFDARIVTVYKENPYFHKALDYPDDPWVNFMRWTHRTYPYGPVWLALTVPLSFLGFQFFLPTLFLFKALMAGSFLGTTYFIGKLLEKINPANKLFGMAFFALSPLIIIESLVSAHHDIVMMFLVILGLHLMVNKKTVRAFLLLLLSIGIKFSTVVFFPIFLAIALLQLKRKEIVWEKMFIGAILLSLVSIIFASLRTELQPWYLLWVLPFVSFLTNRQWITIPSITISLGLLLHYVPFLYTGNWDAPIPVIKFWLTTGSFIAVGLMYLLSLVGKNSTVKNIFSRN